MGMEIYNAFRIFAHGTPPDGAMELNTKWEKYSQTAGLVLGGVAFVLRDWKMQVLSLSCFVAATVLQDVSKINDSVRSQYLPTKQEKAGPDPIIERVKHAAAQANTIFLRYVPDTLWASVKNKGLMQVEHA